LEEKIKEAIKQTALIDVETRAKQNLTSGGHVDTGRLRASIHTSFRGNTGHSYSDNQGGRFNGSLSESPRSELEFLVGTNVVYANYIERRFNYLQSAFENGKQRLQSRLRNII
jgi:hypothetical protein